MPNWTCGECSRSVFGLREHRCLDDCGDWFGRDVPYEIHPSKRIMEAAERGSGVKLTAIEVEKLVSHGWLEHQARREGWSGSLE